MWSASRPMHAREAKRRSRYHCKIDVWGFASILVTLLVILMVFSTSGPDLPIFAVDLAYSKYAAPMHNALREDAIALVVNRDGEVFLGRRAIHAEDLPGAIEAAVASGSERAVYLSVDQRARCGDVKPVIDEIRAAGISNVVILRNRAAQSPVTTGRGPAGR